LYDLTTKKAIAQLEQFVELLDASEKLGKDPADSKYVSGELAAIADT
jgi:hypothetical protein